MNKMNIIDNQNVSYNVDRIIGEGAQGKTYILEDDNYIVKLFSSIGGNETRLKSKINFLIQLELDNEYFAMPQRTIVKPTIGYISKFAKGMVPLESILRPSTECSDVAKWLRETGGLVKRYSVLVRLAWAMRILHGKGLVYCDLSPRNVFVSADPQKCRVMIIDLDNLCYRSGIGHNIFTPFYGAPEVVTKKAPNTTMSDCYSFAVIAYELLTMAHPLIGDIVHDGTPEDEEFALSGNIPWVDDEQNEINRRTRGIPTRLFCSPKIYHFFKRNFEIGLNDPFQRPSMGEWFDVFSEGFNDLIKCDNCGIHYPYNANKKCPLCDHVPNKIVRIQIKRWEIDKVYSKTTNSFDNIGILGDIIYEELLINNNTNKPLLTTSMLLETNDWWSTIASFKVKEYCTDGSVLVEMNVSQGYEMKISTQTGLPLCSMDKDRQDVIKGRKTIRCRGKMAKYKLMFHLYDLTKSQRVIIIDF